MRNLIALKKDDLNDFPLSSQGSVRLSWLARSMESEKEVRSVSSQSSDDDNDDE